MKKVWVFLIGFALLSGSVSSDVCAFSLRSPFQTKHTKWNDTIKEIKDKPFKHRTYGSIAVEVMRVVDGDTFYARIVDVHPLLGYEVGIRVYGIDTREKDDGGEVAKQVVKEVLTPGKRVTLSEMRRGKFFRIVAVVHVDGKSLADILIEKDLAYPYYGGTKRPKGWKSEDYPPEVEE